MKRYLMPLGALFLTGLASANDIGSVVQSVDPGAQIQRDGDVVTVVTSARRVTPHDPPFTTIVPALCDSSEVLVGLEKVIVLNEFAFKGVEFWTYGDSADLTGACEDIQAGASIQSYAVMH